MSQEPVSTRSSGNPYADLGMSDAEARLNKARVAQQITAFMADHDLTQAEMAERLDIDQPQMSRIARGLLSGFSLEKLMELVRRLGFDIDITVCEKTEPTRPAQVIVHPFHQTPGVKPMAAFANTLSGK